MACRWVSAKHQVMKYFKASRCFIKQFEIKSKFFQLIAFGKKTKECRNDISLLSTPKPKFDRTLIAMIEYQCFEIINTMTNLCREASPSLQRCHPSCRVMANFSFRSNINTKINLQPHNDKLLTNILAF